METQTATLRAVHRRLFSRGIQFQKNAVDLLDRLDDITYLLNFRDTEPELGQDIHQAVLNSFETIKDLSFHLKEFILSLEIDHAEFNLLKQVFKHQRKIQKVRDFKYVVGYEWAHHQFEPIKQALEIQRGDLVLMNDYGSFLVVELKYISPVSDPLHPYRRKERLQHVRYQTEKYRSMFQARFPWARVEGLALTNLISYLSGAKKPLQRTRGIL